MPTPNQGTVYNPMLNHHIEKPVHKIGSL